MKEEVVDFFYQSIEITVGVLTHSRKHVADYLFETVFELCF